MFIHLKTKPVEGKEQRFAILIEPEFVPTPKVHPSVNELELQATIREHGQARIHEFEEQNPFHLKERMTVLTPDEFAKEWIGD